MAEGFPGIPLSMSLCGGVDVPAWRNEVAGALFEMMIKSGWPSILISVMASDLASSGTMSPEC